MSPAPAAPTPAPIGALGVPDTARAFLFDQDGVLTQTAKQHAAAWKLMFDDFLAQRARDTGETLVPFDSGADYDAYVDGKPRLAGTESFLGQADALRTHGADVVVSDLAELLDRP